VQTVQSSCTPISSKCASIVELAQKVKNRVNNGLATWWKQGRLGGRDGYLSGHRGLLILICFALHKTKLWCCANVFEQLEVRSVKVDDDSYVCEKCSARAIRRCPSDCWERPRLEHYSGASACGECLLACVALVLQPGKKIPERCPMCCVPLPPRSGRGQ
jgi:hypothetical protein